MLDDLPQDEAESLIAQIKSGDPGDGWSAVPEMPWVLNCAFGVLDQHGRAIQGVVVDFLIKTSVKPMAVHYVFTIFKTEFRTKRRAYQLDILQNERTKRSTHSLPHEHVGTNWVSIDEGALVFSYLQTLNYFCARINLSLDCELKDPSALDLR